MHKWASSFSSSKSSILLLSFSSLLSSLLNRSLCVGNFIFIGTTKSLSSSEIRGVTLAGPEIKGWHIHLSSSPNLCLFVNSGLWLPLLSLTSFFLSPHFLFLSPTFSYHANLLVTRVSSCGMYFSALCIISIKVFEGLRIREPKKSYEVVPIYMASTALVSSKSGICKTSVLNLDTYSLSNSFLRYLTILR